MSGLNAETRKLLAGVLMLATGFWGLVISFSDYPSGWSAAVWLAYIALWHVPSAFIIGFLFPHRWFLSLAAGWGAGLILAFSAPLLLGAFVISIAVAGYFGSLGAKWKTRRKLPGRGAPPTRGNRAS